MSRPVAVLHLAGTSQHARSGYVIKEILRTGEWPVIPTTGGALKRPLRVVRSGRSDESKGVISLEEIVANFKRRVIPAPQIPLSDEPGNDHKNITALNTGFIRDLWIVDGNDGSKLVAKMEITEPEIRSKMLRGTYADVSCGIPWRVVSRGSTFGACLEHVAITNRPFIDGLGPFLALSDSATHFRAGEAPAARPALAARVQEARAAIFGGPPDEAVQGRIAAVRQGVFGGTPDESTKIRTAAVKARMKGKTG